MQDANGQNLGVGQKVSVTGTVTKVSDDSVTLDVAAPKGPAHSKAKPSSITLHPAQVLPEGAVAHDYVYQEYPKMTESGIVATSAEHEAELKAAPKKAEDAAAKDKAAKDKAAKEHDKDHK